VQLSSAQTIDWKKTGVPKDTNFIQEKVLITGPAIDRILKEVHLQGPKDESTGELHIWPKDPKIDSKTCKVTGSTANVTNTVETGETDKERVETLDSPVNFGPGEEVPHLGSGAAHTRATSITGTSGTAAVGRTSVGSCA